MVAEEPALIGVVALLVAHNLLIDRLPKWGYVPACWATTAAIVAIAGGLGAAAWDGLVPGLCAAAVVAVAVIAAAASPRVRPLFHDRRTAGMGPVQTAYTALVRIPLGTVVLEEVAFRGVLLLLLDRLLPLGWSVAAASALFGLWHIVPTRATLAVNGLPVTAKALGAAVVLMTAAGAVLCALRLATGGLLAPALVHASVTATAATASALLR